MHREKTRKVLTQKEADQFTEPIKEVLDQEARRERQEEIWKELENEIREKEETYA